MLQYLPVIISSLKFYSRSVQQTSQSDSRRPQQLAVLQQNDSPLTNEACLLRSTKNTKTASHLSMLLLRSVVSLCSLFSLLLENRERKAVWGNPYWCCQCFSQKREKIAALNVGNGVMALMLNQNHVGYSVLFMDWRSILNVLFIHVCFCYNKRSYKF